MNKLPIIQRADGHGMKFNRAVGDTAFYSVALFLFNCFIFLSALVLIFRLFQLTVVKGDYYRRLSEENRIKEIVIEPKRGVLMDRRGVLIAQNTDPDLKSVESKISSRRVYQFAEALGPVIGYRQLADKNDFGNYNCLTKPRLNEKIGKKGIEEIFECDLRGVAGKKLVELDAHGKYLRTLGVSPAQDGKTITLALDLELQKKAFDAMTPDGNAKRGAVVGIKPKTGEVVVLLSSPSFSPQNFEDNKSEVLKTYLTGAEQPLFNRATQGVYPPGSIIKPFLALGALEDKKIDEKTTFMDEGKLKAGPLEFGNWYFLQYGKTEGEVDVIKGLKRSNDIFFYHLGAKLGPERIKYWGEKFGLAKRTSLPFEQAEGMFPTPFWKEEFIKDQWYLGDSYNLAIGQGYVLTTPFQVALATAALANDGALCQPKLLKGEKPKCQSLGFEKKNLDLVFEGMRQACAVGGTGWPFFEFKARGEKIEVGCKTGTAEAPGKTTAPHAWFTIFAPYKDPEIVLTVLVEEGGQGSDVAAPIAREVLQTYFDRTE